MTELIEVPLGLRINLAGYEVRYFDLQHLPLPNIVRPMALALLDRCGALGSVKSPNTARKYVNGILRFVAWLADADFDGGLEDLTVAKICEYGMQEDRKIERSVRALLAGATPACGVARPVRQEVHDQLLAHGFSATPPRNTPLRAYTRGEYDRIVSACKSVITASESDRAFTTPSSSVVLAYRILIGLEVDIPPECLNSACINDFSWAGDRELRVQYYKARADGAQSRVYTGSGPWSAPVLIRRWIDASASLRGLMDGDDRLWLYVNSRGTSCAADFGRMSKVRQKFLVENKITGDDGNRLELDLRRLRTTALARKTKVWNGRLTADPHHSPTVEGDHYLSDNAEMLMLDDITVTAITARLHVAETSALVLSDETAIADQVDDPELVALRGGAPGSGWDMFAAFCRDPFDSPFSDKGVFCTATVWSCLVCPLAIITPDKLPMLLQLERYISSQSALHTQSEWLKVFGAVWIQLRRILEEFDVTAITDGDAVVHTILPAPSSGWRS